MFQFHYSTLFKALLLLALVLGGCEYLNRTDKLKERLAELNSSLPQLKETAGLRSQEWGELKAAKDKHDAMLKREQAELAKKDQLDQKQRKLEGEIKYLSASMKATVEKARSSAIGTVIPELKLPERSALKNAKILKVSDDSITFLHEDGVANLQVKAEELPAEFVQKYDLGPNSISKGLLRLMGEISLTHPPK
jgi:outer membrane murein-binding lipoprotein Lpp